MPGKADVRSQGADLGQRPVPEMRNDPRMTIASRRHQHPVHHVPAIVKDRIPRERRHSTIRFLHDQIGGGKIPVAALPAGKGGIQRAVRDTAQPQRQRADSRMQGDFFRRGTEALNQRLPMKEGSLL